MNNFPPEYYQASTFIYLFICGVAGAHNGDVGCFSWRPACMCSLLHVPALPEVRTCCCCLHSHTPVLPGSGASAHAASHAHHVPVLVACASLNSPVDALYHMSCHHLKNDKLCQAMRGGLTVLSVLLQAGSCAQGTLTVLLQQLLNSKSVLPWSAYLLIDNDP